MLSATEPQIPDVQFIGREWNSVYGPQKITGRHGDLYEVATIGHEGAIRCYSVNRIEEVIKTDIHRLTPEYKAQESKREEQLELEAKFKGEAESRERLLDQDLAAFSVAMNFSAMQSGMAKKVLKKWVRYQGKILETARFVEILIAEGRVPRASEEDRIKPMSRMAYFRADNNEQDEHERKIKAAGVKKVFDLVSSDGRSMRIGDYGYAYAQYVRALKAGANVEGAVCL
jgi:hypothetical protein